MKINHKLILSTIIAALFSAAASAETGTWTGADTGSWDTTDANWTAVAAGTPWDITNGPTNTALFATAGDSASLTADVYPGAISFTDFATVTAGGGKVFYATDAGASKTITVDPTFTGTINAPINFGGTGANGNILFVNGGGTITLAGDVKLAANDAGHKSSYFSVEGGSTLNITGRLNTMILNSSNRGGSIQYHLGGTSVDNTLNVTGSGKLVVGSFNVGGPGSTGNSVYISAPGTFNTATDPALNTASMVLYGNAAQLNIQSSNNLLHISNGAFVQQTSGGGTGIWKIGNNPGDSNNSIVVTGYGSVVSRATNNYVEIGGTGASSMSNPNPGGGGGTGNSVRVLAGGTWVGGRIGVGYGVTGIATTNNFLQVSGTGSGNPSYYRENGGISSHMLIGGTDSATGNYLQVDSGGRLDLFGTGTGKNFGIGMVAGANNNYVTVTGVGSSLNLIMGQELTVGGNMSVAGGSGNHVDVFDGGSLIMSNIDNTLTQMPNVGGLTFGANPTTSTALVLAGPDSALNIGNGTANTALVKIGAANGHTGVELTNATSSLNFNNGRLTAGVTGNLVTGNGAVNFNGLAYINTPIGFTNTINRPISGNGVLIKEGGGTLVLTDAAVNYGGGTLISGGTLSLSNPVLSDAGAVRISAGAILDLNFAGTDTVASLWLGGVQMPAGDYDATNTGGYITGSGSLHVTGISSQIAPVLSLNGSNPLTFEAAASYTDPGATAIDVVDGTLTPSIHSNTVVPNVRGTYSVTWAAINSVGAISFATRIVNVVDTTAPLLVAPANVTTTATSAAGAVVNYAAGSASDLVGVTSITYSQNSGTVFSIGTTTVTMTARDAAGNTSTGTFTVTVTSDGMPIITLLGANPLTFEAAATYTDRGATATDVEDGIRTPSITSNTVVPNVPGTYSVIWSATDINNNTSSVNRIVNVVDTTAPVVAAHENVIVEATSAAGAIVNYAAADATDAVGVTSLTYSQDSGTVFPIGTTTVTITAQDAAGHVGTRTFSVQVYNPSGLGTWTGGATGNWDTTDANWAGFITSPWDITNGPGNIARFATLGDAAGVTAQIYPGTIYFDVSTTVYNGGSGAIGFSADGTSGGGQKIINVAAGTSSLISADITYGGTGNIGNRLDVIGGGTLTLAGTTKLAANDAANKSSYFSVEGGSTLNINGRLNTMIMNSSNRFSASNPFLGGNSGNNTVNVSGTGKLVTGIFNIGTLGNNGNSIYISSPGSFVSGTVADPATQTASWVLYGNSAQLNMNSSDNLVHISNGAFFQQVVGSGTTTWSFGNGIEANNNQVVVTGLGTTVSRGTNSFVQLGVSGGSNNGLTISNGGLWVGGRVGVGMGNGADSTNNNFYLITGTSDNTPTGVPSYFRENAATNAVFNVGNAANASGNSFRVEAGARADIFGTGINREFAIGKVAGSDNNYVKVDGVGSVLNFITGKELSVGGNSFTEGGSGNHVDVFDGGALVMSNVDNVMPMPSAVSWTTWAAMPTTSTAMVLLGANSSLNIGNGTANTALVKIGAANGHSGVELTNATSSLNFNNGRLTAGVTGNLVTGNGTVNFNGLAYINTPSGFTNTINRPISGNGSLIKEGNGSLVLTDAAVNYGGDTVIFGGMLSLSNPVLSNTGAVRISEGATLYLNFAGTDTVATLRLGGFQMGPGVYDATNSGGYITGSGSLNVLGVPPETAPVVTLLGANPLTVEAAASYTDPGATATDELDGTLIPTITNNTVVPNVPGAYAVTWTATDSSNTSSSATRVVNVVDTTAPVVAAHEYVYATATSTAGAIVNFSPATAIDNVGVTGITYSQNSGTVFPIGFTTVTITVVDAAGNTGTGTFIVTVGELNGPPPATVMTIAASAVSGTTATLNGIVNAHNGSAVVSFDYGLTASYGTNVAATPTPVTGGNDTSVSVALTGLSPSTTYHFRVKAVNSSGILFFGSDMAFTTPLSLVVSNYVNTAATGQPVYLTGSGFSGVNSLMIVTGGNNDRSSIPFTVQSDTSLSFTTPVAFPGDVYLIVSNNIGEVVVASTATFTQITTSTSSGGGAKFMVKSGGVLQIGGGANSIFIEGGGVASEGGSGGMTYFVKNGGTLNYSGGGGGNIGFVEQGAIFNNTNNSSGFTNVNALTYKQLTILDTTAPVVAAHGNVIVEATSAAGAMVSYAAASASDDVGVTSITYSQNSGTLFPIGVTTVTITAKDAANNAGTGTFTVTVTNNAPVVTLTGANPLTFEAAASYTDPGATATDVEDGVRTPSITSNTVVANVPGNYAVTWSATDIHNAAGSATRVVNVVDTTAPAVAAHTNVTVEATSAAGATVTYAGGSASDAVGVTSLTYSKNSGTVFPIGTTTVSITAKDAANNTGTGTFTVTVNKLPQSITFNGSDCGREDVNSTVTLNGTASSGLTVSFAIISGPGSITGNALTFSTVGDVVVRASQAGNATYADATPVDVTIKAVVNTAPVAVDDAVTTTTGTTTLYPLANDTDADGDLLEIASVSDPAVTIAGRSLIIPLGTPSFTYTVTDCIATDTGAVTVSAGTPVVGATTWTGLLYDASGDIAGIMTARKSRTGRITAAVRVGTAASAVSFLLDTAGEATATISLGTLDVAQEGSTERLAVSLVRGADTFSGSLRPSQLSASVGQHNIALASVDAAIPGGGYARVFVKADGIVVVKGFLPDGRSFSHATRLADNGSFVIYALVARTQPSAIVGGEFVTADLTNTDVTGELAWVKGAQARGLHDGGVDTTLTANGCIYTPADTLPGGLVTVTASGGNLAAPLIVNTTATAGVPTPSVAFPNWKVVSIRGVSTGTFSARVKNPANTRTVGATGVYLPKSNSAWGYFPGTTEGGRIEITQP